MLIFMNVLKFRLNKTSMMGYIVGLTQRREKKQCFKITPRILPWLSLTSGDIKSSRLESELVLLTSRTTSLFGSAFTKFLH